MFKGKNILVTGGTGSLGRELVKRLLEHEPGVIRVFDIDEAEEFEMQRDLEKHDNLRFLIGDVRDKARLKRAMDGIDVVFHLAALKHVASCEYNPFEAVKTNVIGTQNIIEIALENDVEKVIYTSSDKAVNPNNTMGGTKLLAERLITSANYFRGKKKTIFSSVRFGNVLGSRGSVLPLWDTQIQKGCITITDPDMTRFVMSKKSAIDLVLKCTEIAQGGEVFIFKMPVVRVDDLADVVIEMSGKKVEKRMIGPNPGETDYEELMTETESKNALETNEMFIIPSHIEEYTTQKREYTAKSTTIKKYDSRDEKLMTTDQIKKMLSGMVLS